MKGVQRNYNSNGPKLMADDKSNSLLDQHFIFLNGMAGWGRHCPGFAPGEGWEGVYSSKE